MNTQAIVHYEGAAALAVAGTQTKLQPAVIKLGLDIHTTSYVVVAQYDHAALRPPRRLGPAEFVPWVEGLLAAGHTVQARPFSCRRLSRAPPPRWSMRRAGLALACVGRWRRPGRAAW